jgi:hypothetical protein
MAIYKVAISFPFDSALPRDKITITPHFFGDNPQSLANALKTNLIGFTPVGAKPFEIKVYDAQKAPPSFPMATASQTGTTPNSTVPREICLCLSYYSTYNRPRYRGRLYIPMALNGVTTMAARPTQGQMDNTLLWANVFKNGLPAQHNWVVYSKRDDKSYGVTNTWVDDEWDIQRSRGLRGTTRSLGTVP